MYDCMFLKNIVLPYPLLSNTCFRFYMFSNGVNFHEKYQVIHFCLFFKQTFLLYFFLIYTALCLQYLLYVLEHLFWIIGPMHFTA